MEHEDSVNGVPRKTKVNFGTRRSRILPKLASLYRSPSNEHDGLVLELSHALDQFRLGESWLNLVPSRCGSSKPIDLATTALIRSYKYAASPEPCLQAACMVSYTRAISVLRTRMVSQKARSMDEIAVSAALLYCAETTLDPAAAITSPHGKALASLLPTAMHQTSADVEILRGLLYFHWKGVFTIPVKLGLPSPFDTPNFLLVEPAYRNATVPEVVILRSLSQKLFIKLPGLIAQVRSLREEGRIGDTVELAYMLSFCKDDAAESKVLHQLELRSTPPGRKEDVAISPFSYEFKSLAQFEAAVYY